MKHSKGWYIQNNNYEQELSFQERYSFRDTQATRHQAIILKNAD